VVGLVTCLLIPVALLLAVISLSQIARSAGTQKGKLFAWLAVALTGGYLLCSGLSMLLPLLLLPFAPT
jgi:hypothetical protein